MIMINITIMSLTSIRSSSSCCCCSCCCCLININSIGSCIITIIISSSSSSVIIIIIIIIITSVIIVSMNISINIIIIIIVIMIIIIINMILNINIITIMMNVVQDAVLHGVADEGAGGGSLAVPGVTLYDINNIMYDEGVRPLYCIFIFICFIIDTWTCQTRRPRPRSSGPSGAQSRAP